MTLALVQARMSSTRLPGKVMKTVLGKPLISYLLERLSFSKRLDKIVVATSSEASDDVLCRYLRESGYAFYRGSESDVLDRFYQAALPYQPVTVVRVTADCPLIDYKVVDRILEFYTGHGLDYVSNGANAPVFPDGMGVEVFSFRALEDAWRQAKSGPEREHVTLYLKNSGRFRCGDYHPPVDYSDQRWTVDYNEDFLLVKHLIEKFYRPGGYFGMEDILAYRKVNPEAFEINSRYAKPRVLLRVDATRSVGMGHWMRCRAMAEALVARGARAIFVLRTDMPELALSSEGTDSSIKVFAENASRDDDLALMENIIWQERVSYVIVDLCHAANASDAGPFISYLNALSKLSKRLVLIDGLGEESVGERITGHSQTVVIPYEGADKRKYPRINGTRFLAGPRYFIFRKEFLFWAGHSKPVSQEVRCILVTMGGCDPHGLTPRVLRALSGVVHEDVRLRVVVGPGFSADLRLAVEEAAVAFGNHCEIKGQNIEMAREMAESDLVISAGGLTKYEAAVLGVPCVVLSVNAHETVVNGGFERSMGSALTIRMETPRAEGLLASLVSTLMADYQRRKRMSEEGKRVVDTQGLHRVLSEAMEAFAA